MGYLRGCALPWNQKNLDYEIETEEKTFAAGGSTRLEIKRTSITRLKLCDFVDVTHNVKPWNQKNLDYEIETLSCAGLSFLKSPYLKSKEPRLRDWNNTKSKTSPATENSTWNQKNLDYEIETFRCCLCLPSSRQTWNQKNLDYEIETRKRLPRIVRTWHSWNQKNLDYEIETCLMPGVSLSLPQRDLKSKEPRLRDWNRRYFAIRTSSSALEIKRTSITRLKLPADTPNTPCTCGLKSKEPRLRDWNGDNTYTVGAAYDATNAWNQKNLDYEIEATDKWSVIGGAVRASLSWQLLIFSLDFSPKSVIILTHW